MTNHFQQAISVSRLLLEKILDTKLHGIIKTFFITAIGITVSMGWHYKFSSFRRLRRALKREKSLHSRTMKELRDARTGLSEAEHEKTAHKERWASCEKNSAEKQAEISWLCRERDSLQKDNRTQSLRIMSLEQQAAELRNLADAHEAHAVSLQNYGSFSTLTPEDARKVTN